MAGQLGWPIACIPGQSCLATTGTGLGYPDLPVIGGGSNCRDPEYAGHTGTDIFVPAVDDGIAVYAAADGQVMWVEDGRFDRCPAVGERDCHPGIVPLCTASAGSWGPATTLSCSNSACNCLWGFNAGNFVLVRHDQLPGIAFTLYAHLRSGSITVRPGDQVLQGSPLAQAGSSGNAARPHLHFGVWRSQVGSLEPVNPWDGGCTTAAVSPTLWQHDPPFRALQQRAGSAPSRAGRVVPSDSAAHHQSYGAPQEGLLP